MMLAKLYRQLASATEHRHVFDSDYGVEILLAHSFKHPQIGNLLFCRCGQHRSFDLLTEDERAQMS
jgi:hypothetical protein